MGWHVTLVSSAGSELSEFAKSGFDTICINMKRNPAPVSDAKALLTAAWKLRNNRDSTILVGTPKASLIILLATFALGYRTRIYDVKGLRYESASGRSRKVLMYLERVCMSLSTHVLAISPSVRQQIVSSELAPPEKVSLVGNGADHGVDTDYYSPDLDNIDGREFRRTLGIGPEQFVIGFVGRINRDKGLSELAEVANRYRQAGKDVRFLVVGPDDSPGYRPFVGDESNVIRIQWVDDPRPYFSAFDVFCLPTYREGLPNVNLQASAMGLPVITTNATGAIDSVAPSKTGILIQPRSAEALEDAIEYLRTHPAVAAEMGRAGRNWVSERFEAKTVWSNREKWLREQSL